MANGLRYVNEPESKKILSDAGIAVARTELASDEEHAVKLAEEIGFPVVLKVVSSKIAHKSDVDGVRVDLETADEVRASYAELAAFGSEQVDGVCVQPFITGGTEVIVGSKRDDTFGPTVVFGLGGVFVEVLKDVTIRVVPFPEREARRMIAEIRGHAVLEGYRGRAADIDALVDLMMKFQRVIIGRPEIIEVDMNPVKVLGSGEGAVVLDARMTMA